MKRGLKITFLPFVFLAVRVESRFSRNVVLVESSADIVLVFGGKVKEREGEMVYCVVKVER